MKNITVIAMIAIIVLFSGCTTKSMVQNGERYTQNTFSSEWKKDTEFQNNSDENATKAETNIGNAAGQVAGAAAFGVAYTITLPIRIIENIVK